jgi:hypothetical protein
VWYREAVHYRKKHLPLEEQETTLKGKETLISLENTTKDYFSHSWEVLKYFRLTISQPGQRTL